MYRVIALSLAACTGADPAADARAEWDAFVDAHRTCMSTAQCAVVEPGCGLGCPVAVSADAAADAEALADRLAAELGEVPPCDVCDTTEAICTAGQCEVRVPEAPVEHTVHPYTTGDGRACLQADSAGALHLRVAFDCLFCVERMDASASATLDGDRLVVTAEGTITTQDSCDGSAGTCWDLGPEADVEALAGGGYTLVYGDAEVAFSVPLGDGEVCAGSL